MNPPLSVTYPGGFFLGFNGGIDRKSAEQILFMCSDAMRNGFATLNLCLSSTGGILDQAHYVSNMLDALPVKIITYNVGNIASSANLLFLCGDERYAVNGATFYFHGTHYPPPIDQVTADYARLRTKTIQYEDTRSADVIAAKTGKTIKDVKGWARRELMMTTNEAFSNGIIHAIQPPNIPQGAFFHQLII